jgi:hypothetical protein
MKFHHPAIKDVLGRLLGSMLILGAIWLLADGQAEARMHWGNPCIARGNSSGSWFSNIFVFSLLVLGVYVLFGSTIINKAKDFIRLKRRR